MPESKSLVLNRKKIIISAVLLKMFKKIQLQAYTIKIIKKSYINQTPYNYKSYRAYIYLFFNDYLFRIFKNSTKGFNYAILSYYALCNLKLITNAGFNDQKQSVTLLKYSKVINPVTLANKHKATRRKVQLPLKNVKTTNRMNFWFYRDFLSCWGKFLNFREKQQYLASSDFKNYRLLKKKIGMAKYLKLFQNYENEYIDESDLSVASRMPVHRSSLARPILLIDALSFKKDAEVLQKQRGIEKYNKELAAEKINTAKYIERLRAKYKKEGDRRLAALKKEATSAYSKRLQKYKDAKKEALIRSTKISKNPDLESVLPIIVIPEQPKKLEIVVPKLEKRVIKFTQHLKADLNDLKWRDSQEITSAWEEDSFNWLTQMSYRDSFLFNQDRVGHRYKKVKAKIRRRRYRFRRRVFGRLKLRRLRKDDKLKIQWGAENNSNVWLFTNYFTPEIDTGVATVNPLSAYSLISYKFKHALAFNLIKAKSSYNKTNDGIKLSNLAISFKYYQCTRFNYLPTAALNLPVTKPLLNKNASKINSLIYFVMRLVALESLNFNNASLLSLLGVIPSTYLKKLLNLTSTRYINYFYNSNFALPSLNHKKIKRWYRKTANYSVKSGTYSLYAAFLGNMLTMWLKIPLTVSIFNLQPVFIKLSTHKIIKSIVRRNIRFHYKIGTGFFLKEAVQVTVTALKIKDPEFFLGWFTKIMEKVTFFKHKQYVMFFRSIFTYLSNKLFKRLGLKGLYFDIRGKVAVKGDSKKRHILLRYGECTFSQKSIKISPAYSKVHTFTGVLGVTFILFY